MTHHLSRTFFVSGHAQQALHAGFLAGVGSATATGSATVASLADVFPILFFNLVILIGETLILCVFVTNIESLLIQGRATLTLK